MNRGSQTPIVVRRIEGQGDATPAALDARLAGLKLMEGCRLPALAPIQRARLQAGTLAITEAWIDGFPLSSVQAQAAMTVDVALALIHDVAQGLTELHRTTLADGLPARLVHGRVNLERIMVDVQGQVRLVGFEGLRGVATTDVEGLVDALLSLLDATATSDRVRRLMEWLQVTPFSSAEVLQSALKGHLRQHEPARLWGQRYEFNRVVRRTMRLTPAEAPGPDAVGFGAPNDEDQTVDAQLEEVALDIARSLDTGPDGRWPAGGRGPAVGRELVFGSDDEDFEPTLQGSPPSETAGSTDDWETPWSDHLPTYPTPDAAEFIDGSFDADVGLGPTAAARPPPSSSSAARPPASLSRSGRPPPAPVPDSRLPTPAPGSRLPTPDPFSARNAVHFGGSAAPAALRSSSAPTAGRSASSAPDSRSPSQGGYSIAPVAEFDRYRVVASIGRGGMGEVYLARKWAGDGPGALVALKVLADSNHDLDFEDAVAMLMDEAAIMASIEHPHVLKVVDFGKALGRYFLATEYLEGRPLVRLMIEAYAREGGLDHGVIATIGADAALGLHAAHTASSVSGSPLKVIHRDVSPQNIFVTYDGVTKVIDFGVARASERVSRTEVGMVKGKTAYMSPEQAEGRQLDGRSDVFGLGVCLWEMIAGQRLFKREQEYETLMAVQTAEVPPPSQVKGPLNPVLDHIVLSALQRDRNRRTPSAHALATELVEYAEYACGPDRRPRVRDMLHRLFGDVAAKEHSLIRRLEANAASHVDVRELRDLSGVAAHGGLNQITLMARPASLNELDDFGTGVHRVGAPTTSEYVIQAVAEARVELGLPPTPPGPSAPAASLPSVSGYGPTSSIPPVAPMPPMPTIPPPDPGSGARVPPDRYDSFEAEDEYIMVMPASRTPSGTAPMGRPISSLSPTAVPGSPPRPRSRGGYLWLLLLLVAGTGAGLGGAHHLKLIPQAWSARWPLSIFTESTTRSAPAPRVRTAAPTVQGARPPPTSAPPPESTPGRTDIETFVRAVRAQGLRVEKSRTALVIGDASGETVTLGTRAQVMRVTAPGVDGWITESKAKALPAVAWVGRVQGSDWYVRSLSVNACRTQLQVRKGGIGLRYADHETRLPPGGGVLLDVALEPPKFADRLEIEPLGLSFGRAAAGRPQQHCRTGWWGSRVVLRRLPPGSYTLRWIGDAVSRTASIELTTDDAAGATLIRALKPPLNGAPDARVTAKEAPAGRDRKK